MTRTNQEVDFRVSILNSLLVTPHRELEKVMNFHEELVKQDPLFYQRLASWYNDKGEIRDHKEAFVINLCMSNFEGHRNVGLAMLRKMPPYQLARVVNYIHDKKRSVPRSVKTEVSRYLAEREGDNEWFDGAVLRAKKHLKRLYALLHIPPTERAQAILFDKNIPEDSRIYQLKVLQKAATPAEQAELIIKYKIPYTVASTVISNMTPTVIYALVDVMSDQELINNISSLQKRGAFRNTDIKELIDKRLKEAKTSKKVSALKSMEAIKAANITDEVKQQLEDVADTQIKNKTRISRPTALLIDKSSSMGTAIELGKQLAAVISTSTDSDFYCYAMDLMPYPITVNSTNPTIADWTRAFHGIYAQGLTCLGCGVQALHLNKQKVEQIILVSDQGENRSPPFLGSLEAYSAWVGSKPDIICLNVGGHTTRVSDKLIRAGYNVEVYDCNNGDYYSAPSILQLIAKPSKTELLMEIMQYPLPERQPA